MPGERRSELRCVARLAGPGPGSTFIAFFEEWERKRNMSGRFVSLAIDHGTTNSCIACMTPQGPRVIPPDALSKILPSAVYFDAKGGLQVGASARNAIMTSKASEGQGFTG